MADTVPELQPAPRDVVAARRVDRTAEQVDFPRSPDIDQNGVWILRQSLLQVPGLDIAYSLLDLLNHLGTHLQLVRPYLPGSDCCRC